jgi:23S rRNA (uridine2552-2'-O)-methyltransferase
MAKGTAKSGGRGSAKGGVAGRSLARQTVVRVKTAKRRTAASTQWLTRQLNDPYVGEAKRQGYRSRAAFKLLQLDDRFHLLRPGRRVVDLGCAPGGWTQVAVERVKPYSAKSGAGKSGVVIGIDILAMDAVPGATIIELDFLAPIAPQRLEELLAAPADVVLSDMAAPTTGHAATDHIRIVALAEAAFAFARAVLAPGGSFLCKVFQGGAERGLLAALKRDFKMVRHAKPPASRAESAEVYVVAMGFRGK